MRPLKTREVGNALIIAIDDAVRVNDGQSDEYRVAIYEAIDDRARPRVVVDLSQVDFLSSSGVAFLISLRRRIAAAKGALVIFGINAYVAGILRTMKLAPIFVFADDEASALALLPPVPTD
jgi:anti-sigma B factor antagonist